jgi:hypothetical protein
MNAIRIRSLFGCLAGFFALAGTVAAQPEFSLRPAPEPWVFAAQAVQVRGGSGSFLGAVEVSSELEWQKSMRNAPRG